jgi:hypothetical protein
MIYVKSALYFQLAAIVSDATQLYLAGMSSQVDESLEGAVTE